MDACESIMDSEITVYILNLKKSYCGYFHLANLIHSLQLAKLEREACQSLCRIWRLSRFLIPASFYVFGIVWVLQQANTK